MTMIHYISTDHFVIQCFDIDSFAWATN